MKIALIIAFVFINLIYLMTKIIDLCLMIIKREDDMHDKRLQRDCKHIEKMDVVIGGSINVEEIATICTRCGLELNKRFET